MDFNKLAIQAIRLRKRVSFTYKGEPRLVEIHAVGLSTTGKPCIRAYQVMGGSNSGEDIGWKLFSLNNINDAKLMDDASLAPRQGYRPNDKGMSVVLAEHLDYVEEFNKPPPP